MRRDKTVVQILFILSVVHFAVAAPAKVSRRFLDEAEGLTPALENRASSSDEEWSPDSSPYPHKGSVVSMNPYSMSSSEGSVNSPEPSSGSSRYSEEPTNSQSPTHDGSPLEAPMHDDSSPVSDTQHMHHDPEPGTSELNDGSHWSPEPWPWSSPSRPAPNTKIVPVDSPAYAGSVQSPQDDRWLPSLGTSPTHGGLPPVSATAPTHNDLSPVSSMHHDPEPGTPEFEDDSHWWTLDPHAPVNLPANGGSAQSPHVDPRPELGAAPVDLPANGGSAQSSHVDPRPELGAAPVDLPANGGSAQPSHVDPRPELGVPPLHDDSISKTDVPFWSHYHGADSVVGSSAPEIEAPQLHGTLPPLLEPLIMHAESPPPPPPPPPPPSVPANAAVAKGSKKVEEPKADEEKFLTDELIQKVKDYAVLGTVAGISTGLLAGVQKEIMGTVTPGASTLGRDLASDVVGHSEGGLLHGLPGHLQRRKRRVSRGLANLRDEDLRLLSVLTSRALESLIT